MRKIKIQRNAPCPCKSGRKYKQCCALSSKLSNFESNKSPAEVITEFGRSLDAFNAGRIDESALICSQILTSDPVHADALHLRGLIDYQRGDLESCVSLIRDAILQNPSEPRYFYNMGIALLKKGDRIDAVEQFRHVLRLDPLHADAHGNLAVALHELGELSLAIESHLNAISLKPGDAVALTNYGATLNVDGQYKEAIQVLIQALASDPDHVEAFNNLGLASQRTGYEAQAEVFFRRAVELAPDNATAHFNLADSMQKQSRLEEIIVSCRAGLALRPQNNVAHSNLLFYLQFSRNTTPAQLFNEHLKFAALFETPLKAAWKSHANGGDPGRRLKLGYVSGDFRNHAVAYFIEPILRHHDAAQVEVYCYHNHADQDVVTERLMSSVPHWIPCLDMSDEQLAAKIRADGIDILIDLSGHTAGNRLLMLARKPAPVQVSWIGYPGTTGLEAMDYFLAERFWLPVGPIDDQFSEKVVRLPATSAFLPYRASPDVNPLPALSNGHLTFGSFNATHKINADVVALWAQLLRAVPDARMLIGAFAPEVGYEGLINVFAQHGVERERLDFHRRCDLDAYFTLHHQVDICLDTFPFSGGTTTAHALWMGVPTLTLAGITPAGRQGCGLPLHVGAGEFVATDSVSFVRQGVLLASDLPALALLRRQLRERLDQSPVCQPALITVSLEQALRTMWQRWCAGLVPERFDVSHHSAQSNAVGYCSKLDEGLV